MPSVGVGTGVSDFPVPWANAAEAPANVTTAAMTAASQFLCSLETLFTIDSLPPLRAYVLNCWCYRSFRLSEFLGHDLQATELWLKRDSGSAHALPAG